MKRIMCVLLALALVLAATALAEPALSVEAGSPVIYTHNGRVTLIDGACWDETINDFDDAAWVVDSVLKDLGGDANTRLDPWRDLTDAFGNRYYVFQQIYNDTTVLGGAVKVITDAQGNMLGLTASIEPNPSDTEVAGAITGQEAERIVLDNARETRQQSLNVLYGLTDRMILPVALSVDVEGEDLEGSRYVWVVYTDNPDSGMTRSSDLPYLAHYVTLAGEYLYSLPTIMPGDEAGASGFDASYVFEFMEPVDYVGYVDLSTGGEQEIAVTVMRDKRTGMHYLGNLERRIVVADCWEFLYNGNRVVLESSPDNLEWDQVGLMTLYNYCRAYDYYKEIGWIGGDGLGTPILVLNDYCDENHKPVDNAAYAGGYLGWQIFLASQCNDLFQSLDVLGHEFTHCVTGTVMTYNAYQNDFGAINEAMSDIQGKTCEMMMEGAENVTWDMGDRSVTEVRSMDDPHRCGQPEFTWDLYYNPNVRTPTLLNDLGGVHTNSSLLNRLAYMLYEKGGMTLEEGRAFWFTVDCAMVPGTDYPQLAELLPWALRAAGLSQYDTELRRALDATRLGVDALPEIMDEDRALLTLSLPDNPIFEDEQWVMQTYGVNIDRLVASVTRIVKGVMAGDYSVLPKPLQAMLEEEPPKAEKKGLLDSLMDALSNDDAKNAAELPAEEETDSLEQLLTDEEFIKWFRENFSDTFIAVSANAGQDGRTMRTVTLPGHTVSLLIHGIYNESTSKLDDTKVLALICGHWFDMASAMTESDAPQSDNGELSPELQAVADRIGEHLSEIHSVKDALDLVFFPIEGGKANELPTEGLDTIDPIVTDLFDDMTEDSTEVQPRMSRPKDVEQAA